MRTHRGTPKSPRPQRCPVCHGVVDSCLPLLLPDGVGTVFVHEASMCGWPYAEEKQRVRMNREMAWSIGC